MHGHLNLWGCIQCWNIPWGLAITSSIVTSVLEKYNKLHPELEGDGPQVLTVGFGWRCFAARCLSFVIGVSGFRGIGVVEQKKKGGSESEGSEVSSSGVSLDEFGGGELNKVATPVESQGEQFRNTIILRTGFH